MTAADRPSVTDNARAEAVRIIDSSVPDDVPGYRIRYAEKAADALIERGLLAAGRAETTTEEVARHIVATSEMTGRDALELVKAIQELQDAETTTATDEDAAQVLDDVIQHLRKIWSTGHDEAREVIDTAEELLSQALPRLLATARTRPTRTAIARAICESTNPGIPAAWNAYRDQWLQDADAVLALFEGGDDQ